MPMPRLHGFLSPDSIPVIAARGVPRGDKFRHPRANPESPRLGIWVEKDQAISAPLSISKHLFTL